MSGTVSRRVLMLYWNPGLQPLRAAVDHHLHALDSVIPRDSIFYYNAHDGAPAWLRHLDFDVIVLHTTFLCMRWSQQFQKLKWKSRWIADAPSFKIALPQDEYDHAEVLDEWLYELGVSVIFSNFDEPRRPVLYPLMHSRARFCKAFTGYIDDATARTFADCTRPVAERQVDIVYRAAHLPYWFGSRGQLKHQIADVVAAAADRKGLRTDISTAVWDTITGTRWFNFLASGRAVIGCESGSSVLDRRGEVRSRIQFLLGQDPTATFDAISAQMGAGWDDYNLVAISPRHFEAVITRTAQILVEGEYDGVLAPGYHYIPLKPDFSNLDDALERAKDPQLLQNLADNAYRDVYLSGKYTYRQFAQQLEAVMPAARASTSPIATARRRAVWRSAQIGASTAAHVRGARRLSLIESILAVWLSLRDPHARSLIRMWLGSRRARAAVGLDQLLADLLKLSIMRRMHAGTHGAGLPCRVDVRGLVAGELRLVSRPIHDDGERLKAVDTAALDEVARAWHAGQIMSVTWDHTALSTWLPYPLTRSHWLSVGIAEQGLFKLEAMAALGMYAPQQVSNLVLSALREQRKPRDETSFGKLLLSLWLNCRDAQARRLIGVWARNGKLRRVIPVESLLADLLKLKVMRRMHAGAHAAGAPFRVDPHTASGGELRLLSRLVADGNQNTIAIDHAAVRQMVVDLEAGRIRQVIWDHTSVSAWLPYPLTSNWWLSLGDDQAGLFELVAIGTLASLVPDATASLLGAALVQRPRPVVGQPPNGALPWRMPGFAKPTQTRHLGRVLPKTNVVASALGAARTTVGRCRAFAVRARAIADRERIAGGASQGVRTLSRHFGEALLVMRFLVNDLRLRRVAQIAARGPGQHSVDPRPLLGDVLRLGALLQRDAFEPASLTARNLWTFDGSRGLLKLMTVPLDEPASSLSTEMDQTLMAIEQALVSGRVSAIEWDFSLIGTEMLLSLAAGRHTAIGMNPDGVYRFDRLAQSLRADPATAGAALAEVVRMTHGVRWPRSSENDRILREVQV